MRTSLLAAPLILAAALAAAAAADTVAHSCHAIRHSVDEAFCVSRLRSVPGAATADKHGHLLMAADLAAATGASAGNAATAMAALAEAGGDTAARDALRACAFLYGAGSVPALRLMRVYAAARSWGAVRSLLMLTGQAGYACDAAIAGTTAAAGGGMKAANHEFDRLSTMATALVNVIDRIIYS